VGPSPASHWAALGQRALPSAGYRLTFEPSPPNVLLNRTGGGTAPPRGRKGDVVRQFTLSVLVVLASVGSTFGQAGAGAALTAAIAPARLTLAEQEQFLLTAEIAEMRDVKIGVTGTRRATLTKGRVTHDASVQTVDESHSKYETAKRIELNFRDYWGYNVAAYRLGVLLGLDMIPPSVERRYRLQRAAFTWWIDDVAMDERERSKRKVKPIDALYHTDQIHVMRVFDELIANIDRNQGNMLFDTRWKLWMIDHSRAFRMAEGLRSATTIRRCERTLLARMRGLTREVLSEQMQGVLTTAEQASLLKRRDKLVAHVDGLGPAALYDLKRPAAAETVSSALRY
jgi:hypothetical protein